jgi:hypothetical protein
MAASGTSWQKPWRSLPIRAQIGANARGQLTMIVGSIVPVSANE